MQFYEIMFIIQPEFEGEELENAVSSVANVLENEGAEITSIKKVGKRRLAYEINDIKEGYYILVYVQSGSDIVPALDHFFKVSEGYLRYMVVRLKEEMAVQSAEPTQKEERLESE